MNLQVAQIQELTKSYFAYRAVNSPEADKILGLLSQLRLNIVTESEMRRIFWDQIKISQLASGTRRNLFYSRNDVDYSLKRGIANLESDVLISIEKRSGTARRFTRESTAWQSVFSYVQGFTTPQASEVLLDFPQELRFGANESLNLGITGQIADDGYIYLHGATYENNFDLNIDQLKKEIADTIPETQYLPLKFQFTSPTSDAVDVNGSKSILTDKMDRTTLITHVSCNAVSSALGAGPFGGFRVSLYDEGKNLQFCDAVDICGVSADTTNVRQNWYELPYPHVLYRGDRLKMKGINGDTAGTGYAVADVWYNLVFKGIAI